MTRTMECPLQEHIKNRPPKTMPIRVTKLTLGKKIAIRYNRFIFYIVGVTDQEQSLSQVPLGGIP